MLNEMPKECGIDRPESEKTCPYSSSRTSGSQRLLTISTRVRHMLNDCKCWLVQSIEICSSNQSGLITQIRTHSRATQKGGVNCRRYVTVLESQHRMQFRIMAYNNKKKRLKRKNSQFSMRNPSLQTEKHIYIFYINVKPHQKC